MPVKTPRDEEKWQKAKEIAKEQGESENYAYIMGIYKKMKPDYFKVADRVAHRFLREGVSGPVWDADSFDWKAQEDIYWWITDHMDNGYRVWQLPSGSDQYVLVAVDNILMGMAALDIIPGARVVAPMTIAEEYIATMERNHGKDAPGFLQRFRERIRQEEGRRFPPPGEKIVPYQSKCASTVSAGPVIFFSVPRGK